MIKKVLSLTLFLFLTSSLAVMAQSKIGYMDSQKVMQNLPQRKTVKKTLTDYAKQQRKKYSDKEASYQKELSNFQKNKSSMSDTAVDNQKKKLTNMQSSLSKLGNKLSQQIQQKRNELMAPILQNINDAIKSIAKANGLDFVVDKSADEGSGTILYASDQQMDITQKVIDHVKSTSKK
jgi:outer membrane protein